MSTDGSDSYVHGRMGTEDNVGLPPILTIRQYASIIDRTAVAIYHRPEEKLRGAARKRGRHWIIWRDRALSIQEGKVFATSPDGSIRLTDREITAAFAGHAASFPLYVSPQTLATMLGVGRATIYFWKRLGRLDGTFVQRGAGIRFRRNQVLIEIFNGENWNESTEPKS